MGYPASGMEKTYRNDIHEVSSFFNERHANRYYIYNLSGRIYDNTRFQNRVYEGGFPDHHPPPLWLLLDICAHMHDWLMAHESNVVAIHCMAGKGRTGVIVSCYMLYMAHYGNLVQLEKNQIEKIVDRAILDFKELRGQGVRFPSQRRYMLYFVQVRLFLSLSSINCSTLKKSEALFMCTCISTRRSA